MALAGFILIAILSQDLAQSPPTSGTIRAMTHTYQLFCQQKGEEIQASETGICQHTESVGVEHFEIRNEDGEAKFSLDAPAGKPFGYVAIFSHPNPGGLGILEVDTSPDGSPGGGPKSSNVDYYFDLSASGLIPFHPHLVGIEGFAQLSSGIALSRTFDTGFFLFSVMLQFDSVTHRVEIMPNQIVFSAFAPHGRDKPMSSPSTGMVKLYASHDSAAPKEDLRIAPGHLVAWWQSLTSVETPNAGQVVKVLAAWAPASLRPADNAPADVQMVYYDWNNLWLQIQVDDRTGWIKGTASFRTIGLQMTNAQH